MTSLIERSFGKYQANPWEDDAGIGGDGAPPYQPPTVAPPVTPPVDPPVSGGGGGGGYSAPPAAPGVPVSPLGPAPTFNGPTFNAPNANDLFNDQGYQFRLRSGSDALQASAAARGLTRTGGTLFDINQYGQKFGSEEYGNAFNRALGAYDRQYQGAKDAYAPQLADWQRAWDIYQFQNLSADQQSQANARNYHPSPQPNFEFNPFGDAATNPNPDFNRGGTPGVTPKSNGSGQVNAFDDYQHRPRGTYY